MHRPHVRPFMASSSGCSLKAKCSRIWRSKISRKESVRVSAKKPQCRKTANLQKSILSACEEVEEKKWLQAAVHRRLSMIGYIFTMQRVFGDIRMYWYTCLVLGCLKKLVDESIHMQVQELMTQRLCRIIELAQALVAIPRDLRIKFICCITAMEISDFVSAQRGLHRLIDSHSAIKAEGKKSIYQSMCLSFFAVCLFLWKACLHFNLCPWRALTSSWTQLDLKISCRFTSCLLKSWRHTACLARSVWKLKLNIRLWRLSVSTRGQRSDWRKRDGSATSSRLIFKYF